MSRRETASYTLPETPPEVVESMIRKRVKSDGVLAGQLHEKLSNIDAEEAAELAASPEAIRAKHEARRGRAINDASEAVRVLVARMRGTVET